MLSNYLIFPLSKLGLQCGRAEVPLGGEVVEDERLAKHAVPVVVVLGEGTVDTPLLGEVRRQAVLEARVDALSDDGEELEAVSGTTACNQHRLILRSKVDDKVGVGSVRVPAHAGVRHRLWEV